MNRPGLLMIIDDKVTGKGLRQFLYARGFRIVEMPQKENLSQWIQRAKPDLIILSASNKNDDHGLKVAEEVRRNDCHIPIILLAKHSSEDRVIAALRAGVNDYLKLPYSNKALLASIKRCLPAESLYPPSSPESDSACPYSHQPMIGDSKCMQEIMSYLLKVASTDSTVLITGETGTGKELAAELIHCNSLRHMRPFVCVNCAALPENLVESELFGFDRGAFTGAIATKKGKFELAGGGTVFLDEIGDMNLSAQAKILRSIENKEVYPLGGKRSISVDVRVIAATNKDPERLLEEGNFREDLYYRLNVARIHLPPLRSRKEDIPQLIEYYLSELNHRYGREVEGYSEESMTLLMEYDWPGNVRELKNMLEATFINLPSRRVARVDLPRPFQRKLKEAEILSKSERERVVAALMATNWNKSTAARKLKWSRMTLYRKMAKYNIVEKRYQER